jgi:hypothetical protein
MKKEEIEKQLVAVLEEANRLQEKSELEMKTAEFLKTQADKLLAQRDNENLPFDEKERLSKQLEAMHGRIEHEIRQFEAGAAQLIALEKKLDYLKQLVLTGQMET